MGGLNPPSPPPLATPLASMLSVRTLNASIIMLLYVLSPFLQATNVLFVLIHPTPRYFKDCTYSIIPPDRVKSAQTAST